MHALIGTLLEFTVVVLEVLVTVEVDTEKNLGCLLKKYRVQAQLKRLIGRKADFGEE